MLDEGVVLEGVFGAFDVDFLERMGGQFVVLDVLGSDAEEAGLGDAEKLVEMGGVAGADLEGAVDVEIAIRIAIDESIYGYLEAVAESADKAAAGTGGDAAHADKDAISGVPIAVLVQTLEHAGGFDGEDELGLGAELKVFHVDGDRV